MQQTTEAGDNYAGSPLVPGGSVHLSHEPARVAVPGPPDAQPVVELVRSGDLVQAIDVTCTCGRRIRLACRYKQ